MDECGVCGATSSDTELFAGFDGNLDVHQFCGVCIAEGAAIAFLENASG